MKTRGPSDLFSPVTGERLNTYDKYRPTEPHPGPCDMACDSLQNQTGDLPSVVRVKVIVKVIDLQTSRQRNLSYMALT